MNNPAQNRVWSAPDFHMVAVEADIVILDVKGDRYHCLPGLADLLQLEADGVITSPDAALLDELVTAGLATRSVPPSQPPAIPPALREVTPSPSPSRADVVRVGLSLAASTAAFRGRSLSQLITRDAAPHTDGDVDEALLARLTGAARRARPWVPFEGECLQRSFQLRALLARWGVATDWVFGVRTWPFGAHCWLQHGDLVIGDRLERVRRYVPIMRR
ncbi:MAG: lasso peptide biosynthesis B2 protein [Brevundimonas sp.]|nr:lasso peptide biosynthesis B2 protein [Brevundimonas sp.]